MESMFLLIPLAPLAALVFFGWLGVRFVRAREQANEIARGGAAPGGGQLGRIEETLEALQQQLQALQERQAFVEKLLERPRPQEGVPTPDVGQHPGTR